MEEGSTRAGGGARLENISAIERRQIQAVANRYSVRIALVGSRALRAGGNGPTSDYDYLIEGGHRIRHSAKYFLPRGPRMSDGAGIDVLPGRLDESRPFIEFAPVGKKHEGGEP